MVDIKTINYSICINKHHFLQTCKMSDLEIIVASAANGGFEFMFQGAMSEGWEPGLSDLGTFPFVDPEGFFIGVVGREIVGCVSAVRFSDAYGFLGYYIVKPDKRGCCYGLRLFRHALTFLGDRNIGLDGVPAQIPNYIKSGFTPHFSSVRFYGVLVDFPYDSARVAFHQLTDLSVDEISMYDKKCFPSNRESWISHWLDDSIPNCMGLAYKENDVLIGYVVMRQSVNGYRIGPLYADNLFVAKQLLRGLYFQNIVKGQTIFIDVPITNHAFSSYLSKDLVLNTSSECTRMYTRGVPPNIDWGCVHALSSLELG